MVTVAADVFIKPLICANTVADDLTQSWSERGNWRCGHLFLQGWLQSLCKLSVMDLEYIQICKEVLVPCVLLTFWDWSQSWLVGRLLGSPLPTNDCVKTDKIQGIKLWEHSYSEAGTQKQQLSGVPPLAISRAAGAGNHSFSISCVELE